MALADHLYINAYEYSKGNIKPVLIPVSTEYSLRICINGTTVSTIACSGSDLESLVSGHLITGGIIESIDEIKNISIDEEKLQVNITTCSNSDALKKHPNIREYSSGRVEGRISIKGDQIVKNQELPKINAKKIISCMDEFLNMSRLHKLTHGVHSSALYSIDGQMIAFFDEIGRHNAIDKAIGYAFNNRMPLNNKIILSTGRLASEIIYKILCASIPVIISRASTTTLSFNLAKKYNVIMIGRVRGDAFCIFNGKDNIIVE